MGSFEERLNKRSGEIKLEELRKAQLGAIKDRESAAEIERLRNILRKFAVREKLDAVREKIWRTGDIRELVSYNEDDTTVSGVALQLFSPPYEDIEEKNSFSRTAQPLFGDVYDSTSHVYDAIVSKQACITVGATSVRDKHKSRLWSDDGKFPDDFIYVSFLNREIGELKTWSNLSFLLQSDAKPSFENYIKGKASDRHPFNFSWGRKMRLSAGDLKVTNFIQETLLELVHGDILPQKLAYGGKQKKT